VPEAELYTGARAANSAPEVQRQIDVSVVVPTRDRPTSLWRCLRALAQQEEVSLEVMVVDDHSVGAESVRRVVDAFDCVTLLRGSGAGPAAARNLGARAAGAEVVCFTDDDCEPDPRWAATIARRVVAGASFVAGITVNALPQDPFAVASQTISNYFRTHGDLGFAASNNVGCRADLVEAVPFDESYPSAAGEDRDWCARVTAAGHQLVVDTDAVVFHHQNLGCRGFARQQLRRGAGAWAFRSSPGTRRGRVSPGFYAGLLQEGFRAGRRPGTLVALSQLLVAAGFLRAAFAEGRSPASRRAATA